VRRLRLREISVLSAFSRPHATCNRATNGVSRRIFVTNIASRCGKSCITHSDEVESAGILFVHELKDPKPYNPTFLLIRVVSVANLKFIDLKGTFDVPR
jgi:hypothetical protein